MPLNEDYSNVRGQRLTSANPLVTVCLQYMRQRLTAWFRTDDRSMFIDRLRGGTECMKDEVNLYNMSIANIMGGGGGGAGLYKKNYNKNVLKGHKRWEICSRCLPLIWDISDILLLHFGINHCSCYM